MRLSLWAVVSGAALSIRADSPLVSHKHVDLHSSNDTDNPTNSCTMHSITCISSDDLKNWTDHGEALQVPRDVSWATYSWAPSAISNNGLVYLHFANGAGSIGVTTSSVPMMNR